VTFIYRIQNVYTFKITYIFIIYHLNIFFLILYWCYIASLLCYSYVCLYYHACLHYVNKKWSDKDTDCTCRLYNLLYLKMLLLHSWNHKNLSFPWIYDMFNFFFLSFCVWRLYPVTTRRPAGGTVRWILKGLILLVIV